MLKRFPDRIEKDDVRGFRLSGAARRTAENSGRFDGRNEYALEQFALFADGVVFILKAQLVSHIINIKQGGPVQLPKNRQINSG